jgi:hypothetical protein
MTDYQPSNFDQRIAQGLRGSAEFAINLLVAIFVAAVLETFIGSFIRVHTLQTVLIKAYALNFLAAFVIGYLVYLRWKPSTAKWLWIIGALWIVLRAASLALGNTTGLWRELIGLDLADPRTNRSHLFLWTLTLIAVRLVAYSLGAWLCVTARHSGSASLDAAILAQFPPLNVDQTKD